MASTSNVTHGVDAEPDNSTFDLDLGLTTDIAVRRDDHELYQYLGDLDCQYPSSPNSVDGSGAYRTPEFEGIVLGGQEDDACRVPMQLLYLPKQEVDDLLLIYPNAKVQADCITAAHYIFVIKLLLYELMMSDKHIREVPHPQSYPRLLLRLSRELKSIPAGGFVLPCLSDPSDYDGCLGELLKDLEETWKEEIWGPDGYVYVSKGTDSYIRCLELAAAELNSC